MRGKEKTGQSGERTATPSTSGSSSSSMAEATRKLTNQVRGYQKTNQLGDRGKEKADQSGERTATPSTTGSWNQSGERKKITQSGNETRTLTYQVREK